MANNGWTKVRTKKGGVTIVGPQPRGGVERVKHLVCKPTAILFAEPSCSGVPVNLGAYSPEPPNADEPPQWPESRHIIQHTIGLFTYYSSAPLARISCIHVFEDETGLCRGMLFEYLDGTLRAVGQCRLGVDHRITYKAPSVICSRITITTQDWTSRRSCGVKVVLGSCAGPISHPPARVWNCRPLSGTLHFWFSESSTALSVLK